MTHTPEQIKFMLDDMKKNNYHVYKLLTELLEETGRTCKEKSVLREPPERPPCREFHSFWHTETKESKRKTREWRERQKRNGY